MTRWHHQVLEFPPLQPILLKKPVNTFGKKTAYSKSVRLLRRIFSFWTLNGRVEIDCVLPSLDRSLTMADFFNRIVRKQPLSLLKMPHSQPTALNNLPPP